MKIKRGVVMSGLKIEMRPVLVNAGNIWRGLGKDCVVTSALDGNHSDGSLHYYGYAVDLRSRYFNEYRKNLAAETLRRSLSKGYTVIAESDHIHVQYSAILDELEPVI